MIEGNTINPQLEDGHIRIAREIEDALSCAKLSLNERQVIRMVIRMSWGCKGHKVCELDTFADILHCTGLHRTRIKKVLQKLERKRILVIDWDNLVLHFNKHYDTWRVKVCKYWNPDRYAKLVYKNINAKENSRISKKLTLLAKNYHSIDLPISKKLIAYKQKTNTLLNNVSKKLIGKTHKRKPQANPHEAPLNNSILNNKQTTTTEDKPSQVTGSSSEDASQLGTEAPEGMSNDITILKGVILAKKWPSVSVAPSYTACRRLIEEADGDVNVVIEAIGRMSITLKYEQNGDDVAGAIMAYVKNPHYGRSKEAEVIKAPPTLQQRLDAEITRLDDFQKQVDANPRNATDELCIKMLAQIHLNIDDLKKEIQNADTATAS